MITFSDHHGALEALEISREKMWWQKLIDKKERQTIFGEVPVFERATAPSDIIWENIEIRNKPYRFKANILGALIICIVMLSTAFFAIFSMKKVQIRN
jgi:hypothetical protein